MKKKVLQISSNNLNLLLNDVEITKIVINNKSFQDILNEIERIGKENFDFYIIPAEETISNESWGGVELVKHIRLTPDLKDFSLKPIVLLHWLSIDSFIKKDEENIFLYSPGIYTTRLPELKIDFGMLKSLDKGVDLKPYLFGSEKDEKINDHLYRNEQAIAQFESQLDDLSKYDIVAKSIWQKKILYRNLNKKNVKELVIVENVNFENFRILIADDFANQWMEAIEKVVSNATLIPSKNLYELEEKLNEKSRITKSKVKKIIESSDYPKNVQLFLVSLQSSNINLLLLDINFSTEKMPDKVQDTQGFEILQKLKESEIYLPVIIFSATTKNIEPLFREYNFICGQFIKSYSTLLEFIELVRRTYKLKDMIGLVNCLSELIKYSGDFYKITKGRNKILYNNEKLQVKLIFKSIVENIILLTKTEMTNVVNKSEIINRYLDFIVSYIVMVKEIYYEVQEDSLQKQARHIRNGTFHAGNFDETYENAEEARKNYFEWKNLKFENKVNFINKIMNRTIKGLIFGI